MLNKINNFKSTPLLKGSGFARGICFALILLFTMPVLGQGWKPYTGPLTGKTRVMISTDSIRAADMVIVNNNYKLFTPDTMKYNDSTKIVYTKGWIIVSVVFTDTLLGTTSAAVKDSFMVSVKDTVSGSFIPVAVRDINSQVIIPGGSYIVPHDANVAQNLAGNLPREYEILVNYPWTVRARRTNAENILTRKSPMYFKGNN